MKFFSLVVLVLIAPGLLLAQKSKPLKNLDQLSVVVEDLGEVGSQMGLSHESLESVALVALKHNLPNLKIDQTAASYLYIKVLAVKTASDEVAAYVSVEMKRDVKIVRDFTDTVVDEEFAPVWYRGKLLAGPRYDMASRIRQSVTDYLTEFAADYNRQN